MISINIEDNKKDPNVVFFFIPNIYDYEIFNKKNTK
jgi:hypothetical protein